MSSLAATFTLFSTAAAQDAVAASAAPELVRPLAGYDGGFFLRSADDAFRFTLEGLLQVQAKLFESGLNRTSEFELERMRLEFSGEFQRLYRFHVEPKFSEDDVELEEAWIGVDLAVGGPLLLVGRMKEPFSLEEMLPRKHLDFATFSLLNQFVPAEDHGVTLLGTTDGGRFEYGAAIYNGTGGDDTNGDKDVALRGVLHPFASDESSPWRGLQFGASATFGRQDDEVDGDELRTEARVPFATYEPGSALDGDRTRIGLEAAWLRGPFALYGEAIALDQHMQGPADDADIGVCGWYVGTSWVLTGEEKTWRGVHPKRPIARDETHTSGRGAWQLAGRFSRLDLDDDYVDTGILAAQSFPGRVTSVDLGLNWYATYNARVKLHAIHTEYDEEITVDGESRTSEDALLLQFQLHF